MELKFTPWRLAALVVLIVAYAIHGGFVIPPDMSRPLFRLWLVTLLLFLTSALSATLVDHWIGRVERSNLRWFYVVAGVSGMAGALVLLHTFREKMAVM
ncbi:MAG: hypothetical protein ACPG4K_07630 [Haloferula sp.]